MKIKKFFQAFTLIEILIAVAIIGVLAALLLPQWHKAQAQPAPGSTVYQPNFYTTISNYTGLQTPSNGVPVVFGPATNQNITIHQNEGDFWLISLTTSNNSTGNYTIWFDVNDDGVSNHWTGTNTHYCSWTFPLQPNNTWVVATNFPRDLINNFRGIYPTVASNSCLTNFVQVNFLHESHGNQF